MEKQRIRLLGAIWVVLNVYFAIDLFRVPERATGIWLGYLPVILATSCLGLLVGILLIALKRAGRILALICSVVFLILRLSNLAGSYPHILERTRFLFTVFLPKHPVLVIINDIFFPVLLIFTIIFLNLPKVKAEFVIRKKSV